MKLLIFGMLVSAFLQSACLYAMQKESEHYYLKAALVQEYKIKPTLLRIFASSKKRAHEHLRELVAINYATYKACMIQEAGYGADETLEPDTKKRR